MRKHLIPLLLMLALVVGLLAGCGTPSAEQASSAEESAVQQSTPPQETTAVDPEVPETSTVETDSTLEASAVEPPDLTIALPISDSGATYTFWVDGAAPFVTPYLGEGQSYNTAACTEYLESVTGVHIEYKEVDMFSAAEEFSLMIASGDYCDMFSNFSNLYSGGYAQGLLDEVIIPVNDLVEGNMPNYSYYLDTHPDYIKELVDDDGNMLFISGFQDESYTVSGAQIRQDWLDNLGLDTPVTFDDWYEVGKAFQSEYGGYMTFCFNSALNPSLSFSRGYNLPGFAVNASDTYFYQVDGQVHAAYTEDSMKDFISMLQQWYQDGILCPDFYSYNGAQDCEGNIISDQVGIFWGEATFVGTYNAQSENPDCHFVGLQSPVLEEGQEIHFSTANKLTGVNPVAISTTCEDPEILATWLDYHFTEEGQLLSNYGMEGGSFEYDDQGQPQFNDFVVNNPDGLNFKQTTSTYILYATPSIFDADCQFEVLYGEEGTAAIEVYSAQEADNAWAMPDNITYSNEESEVLYESGAINDMDTTAAEYLMKFVTGSLDIEENWDAYVTAIEGLGLEDCIAAKQSALDRYNAR